MVFWIKGNKLMLKIYALSLMNIGLCAIYWHLSTNFLFVSHCPVNFDRQYEVTQYNETSTSLFNKFRYSKNPL